MKFKHPSLESEFKDALDDEVRLVVQALDAWSFENNLPEVVVTQVLRSPFEQEEIYARHGLGLIRNLKAGHDMPSHQRGLALELEKLKPDELRAWARGRFSWHLVGQAVDLRNREYSPTHLLHVMEFLGKRCPRPEWELLSHDTAGPHLHIARRESSKRKDVQ